MAKQKDKEKPVIKAEDPNWTPYTLESLLAGATEANIHKEIDTGRPVGREIC
ncbi:MAG: antitoxin component of MazEF toxin-antitoxin module [Candidatus Latescibacterota bacterium]|jgi:antitoxin component of MazEF toxin-antitoxin module